LRHLLQPWAALAQGCNRLIIGIGGSATNDGGAGMAQALGVRMLNARGEEIAPGAARVYGPQKGAATATVVDLLDQALGRMAEVVQRDLGLDLWEVPVLAVVGSIGPDAGQVYAEGMTAIMSIAPGPITREESIARAGDLIADAAEQAMRLITVLIPAQG
jgi:glycerate kinase